MSKYNKGDYVKMDSLGVCRIEDSDGHAYFLLDEDNNIFRRIKIDVHMYGEKIEEPKSFGVKKTINAIFVEIQEMILNNPDLQFHIKKTDTTISVEGLGEMPDGELIPIVSKEFLLE